MAKVIDEVDHYVDMHVGSSFWTKIQIADRLDSPLLHELGDQYLVPLKLPIVLKSVMVNRNLADVKLFTLYKSKK